MAVSSLPSVPPTGRNQIVEFGPQRVSIGLENDHGGHDIEPSPTIGLDVVGLVHVGNRTAADTLVVGLEDVALAGPGWGRHSVVRGSRINRILTRAHYAQ
jgi:hypothetical protein